MSPCGARAQMAAAQRIDPAVEDTVRLRASAGSVWAFISDPANYAQFSGADVVTSGSRGVGGEMALSTDDGEVRKQTVAMLDEETGRVSFMVSDSKYAPGKQWVYLFRVEPEGNNKRCRVVMSVYFAGEAVPEKLKEGMAREFRRIAVGLTKKFR